jgi:hypothetical protein
MEMRKETTGGEGNWEWSFEKETAAGKEMGSGKETGRK